MVPEKTIADIDLLLSMKVGDPLRLEHIKECHLQDKTLYKTDEDYFKQLRDKYIVKSVDPANHEKDTTTCLECGAEILSDQMYCSSCADPPRQQDDSDKFCEGCGGSLDPNDSSCPQCSQENTLFSNPAWPLKSKRNTLVLSIVFGLVGFVGLGHLYLGKFKRGVALIIYDLILFITVGIIAEFGWEIVSNSNDLDEILSFLIGLVVLGVIAISVYIWQIFDARKLCREYNACVSSNGRPPW